MPPMLSGLIVAAVLALLAGLIVLLHSRARLRAQRLAAYLAPCKPLFTDVTEAVQPSGFGRLSGRHAGALFDLQVVPDTLTYRKLPALWLLVTLPEPMPVGGTLDLMLRPTGVEPFSHFRNLPVQITPPPGFPADCTIRIDDAASMPAAELLLRRLAGLNPDRLKEIVISPKGLRIVWLAEEADRTRFLLFRDAEMARSPIAHGLLPPLLSALLDLRHELQRAASLPAAERRIA